MNKPFIGGSDVDLVTSLVDSFLYQETEKEDEILATYLMVRRNGPVFVCNAHISKNNLLAYFDDFADKGDILSNMGLDEDEYREQDVVSLLLDAVHFYGWFELHADYHPYTLEEWHEINESNLNFEMSDLKAYLYDVYQEEF